VSAMEARPHFQDGGSTRYTVRPGCGSVLIPGAAHSAKRPH
jgi:hypothetical protein